MKPPINSSLALVLAVSAAALAAAGCNSSAPPVSQEKLAERQQGQRLFRVTCASCHIAGSERTLIGPGLHRVFDRKTLPSGAPATEQEVRDAILKGRRNMPGYKDIFSESQVNAIIEYLRTL